MSHPKICRLFAPLILLCALCLNFVGDASAHPANVAGGRAKVAADGTFVIDARFDVLAYVLGETSLKVADAPMNALLDGPPENLDKALKAAGARFVREMAVKTDKGAGTLDSIQFPTLAQVQDWRDNGLPPRLPVLVTTKIKGHFPPDASSLSFGFPPTLGTFVFTEEVANQEPFTEALENGAFSTPFPLRTGMPKPTPQNPNDSPSALYKPKPKAPAKSSVKPAPKPAPRQAPVKPKAPAKPAPKATSKPKKSATVPVVPPKSKPPIAGAPKAKSTDAAPAKSPIVTAQSSVQPAPQTPVAQTKASDSRQAKTSKTPQKAANSGSVGAASDKIEGSPSNSASTIESGERPIERAQNVRPSWFATFSGFVEMGFTHILPAGLDHILFVVGLFLLGSQLPALIKQITAFTVAHSLTLALAAAGLVRLPASIIEPLIALSIVFVAVENLTTKEVRPWRLAVVFAFGLVHGLGFAEVFQDLGLSGVGFISALAGFNIGVELGQLSVVALALLAVGWFRQREGYRRFVVVPASLAIAAVAAFWTLQRVFFTV